VSLYENLGEHDRAVLAGFVATGLKHHHAPDWRDAWPRLSDLARHQLEKAPAAEIFDAALEAWANAPHKLATRLIRKGLKGGLRAKFAAEAVRHIEAAKIGKACARAVDATA